MNSIYEFELSAAEGVTIYTACKLKQATCYGMKSRSNGRMQAQLLTASRHVGGG